jgi:hypothetical protein
MSTHRRTQTPTCTNNDALQIYADTQTGTHGQTDGRAVGASYTNKGIDVDAAMVVLWRLDIVEMSLVYSVMMLTGRGFVPLRKAHHPPLSLNLIGQQALAHEKRGGFPAER